jgi:hypothetical protein
MALELLLARADDHRPLFPQGLELKELQALAPPLPSALPDQLWDASGDPDLLPKQRWGVVVPEGAVGKQRLARIERLVQLRQREQGGAPVRIYSVRPNMDGPSAVRWKRREFRKEAVSEPERPRYLLLLGDMEEISLELQQVLSTDAFVGRLALPTEEAYEAYAAKVLRWESEPARSSQARVIFYTAQDGTGAVDVAHQVLVAPSIENFRKRQGIDFPAAELVEFVEKGGASTEQWLSYVSRPEPAVLLSLSHGLGAGWDSPARRRERQGALVLPGQRLLSGEDLASRPFLPGGIWFCLACYSAGTPARSTYEPWLHQLRSLNPDAARTLETAMPGEGDRPFTAALPQAALANPDGPLAVIGHVDLAWTSSMSDQGRLAHSRFLGVLKALAEGRRAGNALHTLLRFFNEESAALMLLYKKAERATRSGRQPVLDARARAQQWVLCQDLANYVLLGDPAVRPGWAISAR